jgi:hypothetical protein
MAHALVELQKVYVSLALMTQSYYLPLAKFTLKVQLPAHIWRYGLCPIDWI